MKAHWLRKKIRGSRPKSLGSPRARRPASYGDRMNQVRAAGLGTSTVFKDMAVDRMTGGAGDDWFFAWYDPTAGKFKDMIGDLISPVEQVDKIV